MASIGSKKPRAAEAAEEADPILAAVEKLQQIQQELEKVNEEANEEILEIEQKYLEKVKPVYKRRNEIISQIPDFWLTTFMNHPSFENLLTEEDEKIFKYLESINVDDFESPRRGYCIMFNFKTNPFFKNKKLTKTITFSDDGTLRSIGTTIKWKVGKGPNDKRRGKKRALSLDSFFSWFSSPGEDDLLQVAETIKKEIWPNPIESLDNLEDEDDYDDSDNDDSDDDEEEDAEEGDEDGSAKN